MLCAEIVALSSRISSLLYWEHGRLIKAEYGLANDNVHLRTVGFIYLVLVNHYGKRWLEAKNLFGILSHFVLFFFICFCVVVFFFFSSTLKSVENGKFNPNQPEDFHFDYIIRPK